MDETGRASGRARDGESEVQRRSALGDALILALAMGILLVPPGGARTIGSRAPSAEWITRDLVPLRVEINSAAWYEWAALDGIGETRARQIVKFRAARGGFASIEDLREVPGLSSDWVDRSRRYLACTEHAESAVHGGPKATTTLGDP